LGSGEIETTREVFPSCAQWHALRFPSRATGGIMSRTQRHPARRKTREERQGEQAMKGLSLSELHRLKREFRGMYDCPKTCRCVDPFKDCTGQMKQVDYYDDFEEEDEPIQLWLPFGG